MNGLSVLTKIVSHPRVYDAVQFAVGQDIILRRLTEYLADVTAGTVLDVGAGTGAARAALPANVPYLWLDIDKRKLEGYRRKSPAAVAILGDATCIPLSDASVDTAVCMFMTHHLSDEELIAMLRELRRVIRKRLILLDAVRCPGRIRSRLLWALDRGDHPREPSHLRDHIGGFFTVTHDETFDLLHRYFLCSAVLK